METHIKKGSDLATYTSDTKEVINEIVNLTKLVTKFESVYKSKIKWK